MCFAHDVSEHGLQQFHRSPPSPDRVGPVASCARTPGTRDTHTEGHQQGLCRATLAATHQERTLGPRHTHGSYGRSRRQGGRKHPQNPTGSLDPGLGLTPGVGQLLLELVGLCRRNGTINTSRLVLALGTAWIFRGACAALRVSPEHHSGCDALTSLRGCASTTGTCAEELPPPSSPRPAPRIHRSLCSPSVHPGLTRKPQGKVHPSVLTLAPSPPVTDCDCRSPEKQRPAHRGARKRRSRGSVPGTEPC